MASAPPTQRADVVLVGGGLANSLIALRLKSLRPRLRVILLEQGATIGGEHTWCHFATDVDAVEAGWLRPLIVHRWSGYEVRFPGHSRQLSTDYLAITSERLHKLLSAILGQDAWLGATVSDVNPHQVTLADGRTIAANYRPTTWPSPHSDCTRWSPPPWARTPGWEPRSSTSIRTRSPWPTAAGSSPAR